jgi:hypothetical protein
MAVLQSPAEPHRFVTAMPSWSNIARHAHILVVFASAPLFAAEQKTFTSDGYGYRLRYPKAWNVSESGSGVPLFSNYSPSEAGPQGLFPSGGAEIYLIPFAAVKATTSATTLKEWIQSNSGRDHSKVAVRSVPRPAGARGGPQNAFEVKSDFERDPQDETLQREINYYFDLHGAGFRLMLLYWKGDSRALYFESVLRSVFRSITALGP